MDTATCKSCRFFEDLGDGTGSCLRNPPQIASTPEQQRQTMAMVEPADGTFVGVWPVVPAHAWCGEWRQGARVDVVPAGSPAGSMSLEQALAEFGTHVNGPRRKPLAAVLVEGPITVNGKG